LLLLLLAVLNAMLLVLLLLGLKAVGVCWRRWRLPPPPPPPAADALLLLLLLPAALAKEGRTLKDAPPTTSLTTVILFSVKVPVLSLPHRHRVQHQQTAYRNRAGKLVYLKPTNQQVMTKSPPS